MNIRRHIRRPRASTVIASLALFVALGGSATAATLITGAKIKNGSIAGKDFKNSTLTGSKVKNGSLSSSDLGKSTKGSLKGPRGDQGAAGQAGPGGGQGGQGAPGPNGIKAPQTDTASAGITGNNVVTEVMSKAVPAGSYMVSVKGYMYSPDVSQVTCRLFNGATEVDQIDWNATSVNGLRFPARMVGVASVTTGPLSVRCQKTGAGAGVFSLGQIIAIPTS